MTFCPKCGNKLRPGLHFCPKCGTEIDASRYTPEPVEPVPDNASPGEANNIPPIPHSPTSNDTANELSDSLATAADALGGLAAKAGAIAAGAVGELASRAKDALDDATASAAGKQEVNSTANDSPSEYRDAAGLDEALRCSHQKQPTAKAPQMFLIPSPANPQPRYHKLRKNSGQAIRLNTLGESLE